MNSVLRPLRCSQNPPAGFSAPIYKLAFLNNFIQIPGWRCLSSELVNKDEQPGWCETLYQAKAAELILYGRALGLSHGEAEDVLHETFVELMKRAEVPTQPEHYCVRSFRNRASNYRRSLWRRVAREFESVRWFERSPEESHAEREAMRCPAGLPPQQTETIGFKNWHENNFQEI